tara:strand:- start:1516 stop:1704 length:189 start_codon:yes stop_codon:yes gene_type:complete
MVEAAGIEPASENNQPGLLHAYPELYNWPGRLLQDGYGPVYPEKFNPWGSGSPEGGLAKSTP